MYISCIFKSIHHTPGIFLDLRFIRITVKIKQQNIALCPCPHILSEVVSSWRSYDLVYDLLNSRTILCNYVVSRHQSKLPFTITITSNYKCVHCSWNVLDLFQTTFHTVASEHSSYYRYYISLPPWKSMKDKCSMFRVQCITVIE